MDATQRSYFTGVVKNLRVDGGTTTYSVTLVALNMIEEKLVELKQLSNINESVTINSNTDDEVHQLKRLFSTEF